MYAKYPYPDGRVVYRKPDKSFPQSGNTKGKDRALFHADRIGDAQLVFVVEGEEDVYAIEAVGGVAVSSAMGAGKAHLADWEPLRGSTSSSSPTRTRTRQAASMPQTSTDCCTTSPYR